MVPMVPQTSSGQSQFGDKDATFGQRRAPPLPSKSTMMKAGRAKKAHVDMDTDAPMEISWVPSASSGRRDEGEDEGRHPKSGKEKVRRKGVESFGAGLERGVEENVGMADSERKGRTQRRKGVRSGSKNAFRGI